MGFLALSLEPDARRVASAAREMNIQMTIATTDDEVLGPLGVKALPSTIFVDSNGVIVASASGGRTLRFFRKRTAALLH